MCGQFLLAEDAALLADYYDIVNKVHESLEKKIIYPSMNSPVILKSGDDYKLGLMSWGMLSKGMKKPVINARTETVLQKPMFAPHMVSRRCAVPFSAYYEWDGAKKPHTFFPKDATIAAFAGVYRKDPDGVWRFAILTKESSGEAAKIHPRVPVTLSKEAVKTYLAEPILESVMAQMMLSDEIGRIENGKLGA